ncbi:hypothetical protein ACOMHN_027405 [Nucella lapillus]
MFLTYILVTCVIAVTFFLRASDSKTVVSIPSPSTSHTKYHTKVARALARKGHQVWVTIPTYLLDKGYLDTSGFDIIPYDTIPGLEEKCLSVLSDLYFKGAKDQYFEFLKVASTAIDHLLRNDSFISAIGHKRPDLIVIDNIPTCYVLSVIPYRLVVSFAFLGSIYYAPMLRIPFSPADVPFRILPYSNKMSFFQRLHNTLVYTRYTVNDPSFPQHAVSTYAPEKEYMPLNMLMNKAEIG